MLAEPKVCVGPAGVPVPNNPPQTKEQNSGTRKAQVVKILGEGAFGEVKLVVDPRNPMCCVALKCIDLRKFQNNSEALNQFKKEAYLQRLLSSKECDNMIRYIGMRVETEGGLNELQIYLEYADGGELFDQIEPDVGMPPVKAQFYFRQLLNGLKHIHSMGVVHRDIKPENLLLTGQDVLKISDFGMATVFRHSDRERMLNATCGTLPYASPQVIKGLYKAEPVDIWSSGVVLVAMLAGELPWDSASRECPAYNEWVDGTVVVTENNPWRKIENTALSLIRAILTENENTRATLQRIMEHPWTNANFGATKESSVSVPAIKRKRLSADRSECSAASQPSAMKWSSPVVNGYNSFSQPAEALLLSNSQLSQNLDIDPMAMMVRRMTRFCVTVCGVEVVSRIKDACVELGFLPVEKANKTLLITYRDMSFMVTIYEVPTKVLVDCRRSRGDGLEFKRAFLLLKASLSDIISKDGESWMESRGLTCSQNAEVASWTRRGAVY